MTERDFEQEFGARLDDLCDRGSAYELWIVSDAPHIKAYELLDNLGLRDGGQGTGNLGDLIFEGGGTPGFDYFGVTTEDLLSASLLQQELNKRNTGIKVEVYEEPWRRNIQTLNAKRKG